jgi:hypothetical protein
LDTTVTGIFPNRQLASTAVENLVHEGFPAEQVRIVSAQSEDRHEFIEARTADTKRAVEFGIVFGTLVGALTGVLLSSAFGLWPAVGGGILVGAIGGTILGTIVGRATTTQVQDELEHQVDGGTVLVSVQTDADHGPKALELLAKEGAVNMVSTAASFTAGVLPVNHPGGAQQELPKA